jgi:hypothetical protein
MQAAAAAHSANGGSGTGPESPGYSSEQTSPTVSSGQGQEVLKGARSDLPPPPRPGERASNVSTATPPQQNGAPHELARTNSMGMVPDHMAQNQHLGGLSDAQAQRHMTDSPGSLASFGMMQDYSRHSMGMIPMNNGQTDIGSHNIHGMPQPMESPNGYHYNDPSFGMMQEPQSSTFSFGRPGESPLPNFMAASPAAGSPGWLSLPSPNGGNYPPQHLLNPASSLKYPVLQPLLPKLTGIIPSSLACDLLDLYFSSSSSAHVHPLSPYLLGFVFRKRSFLHPTRPRYCSPALLASMLWLAAQTSEAPFLTSPPAARGKICQKLLELTVTLLKPLIHGTGTDGASNIGMNTVINGVALGGLGVADANDQMTSESGGTGTLDDVATYFHLATVISASEYKAASLRWWNVAWSLARELKLGRELPPNPPQQKAEGRGDEEDAAGEVDLDIGENHSRNGMGQDNTLGGSQPGTYTEEEREERRRMWWLLYTMDRHLALCYNRPLFLLDIECADLLQPVNDDVWQAGEFFTGSPSLFPDPHSVQAQRHRGPSFECTSHSIFGYFTPLMTILGEIIDLNHARAHPRFGLAFRSATEWDDQTAEITQQLELYGRSLKAFEARHTAQLQTEQQEHDRPMNDNASAPSVRSINSNTSKVTENMIHTKTVLAYGTHVMHVLHILLTGKWDPICLLDDSDLWISSQSFVWSTTHAVSAAEAVSEILEYDPDLSFMPFFFGIYLLQGSFLLLLIADKLQGEASQSVVGACEVVVRAVEACVVTLNTEYQVSNLCNLTPFPSLD